MDIADVVLTYSGGSSNGDQALSIGGVKSSVVPATQQATGIAVSGVTVLEIAGMHNGDGQFIIDPSNSSIAITPPEGSQGVRIGYAGGGDRTYFLAGASGASTGYMLVDVVEASLPTVYSVNNFVISTPQNALFPDVTKTQATNGIRQHRCIYVTNANATIEIAKLALYLLSTTEGDDVIEYAVDTDAGVGDGVTTGVAVTLIDETDPSSALSNLVFESELDPLLAQELIEVLAPGESVPIWIKRTVPKFVSAEVVDNAFTLGINAYVGD